ncbi:MAG: UDP-glucose--hexose-1-phosphate uridylyltransferase [Spirochaetia bacterium]|jgi:UDPglucose--hexose-1-phosphate uridylyltransferase|nr:UDP-glucose--hexose-1-phosphate uridylyltransferase [Spirochaetia bacterium]
MINLQDTTHNRYNPLTGEWVKISPHRAKRPWQGQVEAPQVDQRPQYDPHCYLCPGNTRSSGNINPNYTGTYVFTNDFSALLSEGSSEEETKGPNGLLKARGERGICKVICFSPRHDLTLARMPEQAISQVIDVWKAQYLELGTKDFINHVQIFENRGPIMGCSNPHPHGQIWAEEIIPDIPRRELEMQEAYAKVHESVMLLDYALYEAECKERIIVQGKHFLAVVPFWATWPYEAMVLPYKRAISSIDQISEEEEKDLAHIIKRLGIRFDNLFKTSFPYSMGIHQMPTDGKSREGILMHFHYLPPLLRSATVKKFMVGYEMLAMPQRDITPEQAARTLRSLPDIHYIDMLKEQH